MGIKKTGLIRPTKRTSADRQREILEAAGADLIEDDWEIAKEHIRPGDILSVASLHLLAPDEAELRKRLRKIEEYGGQIEDVGTGQVHAPHTLLAYKALKQAWQDEKHCKDPKEMRRRGKMGGAKPKIPPKSAAEKMVLAYKAMGKTEAEIVADLKALHRIEVSEATVSRLWARKRPKQK